MAGSYLSCYLREETSEFCDLDEVADEVGNDNKMSSHAPFHWRKPSIGSSKTLPPNTPKGPP